MPAINFKKEFSLKVESGEKCQTIRALRKDGRNPHPGQTLYLYTGMRTKYCRKLGEAVCKNVTQITIEENEDIIIGITTLNEVEKFIKTDGFDNIDDFYNFFRKVHGLPFYGLLIQW